ncbi:MAG: protein kinase domain-containing protein [Longimicrobiales bacterium]
MRRLTRPGQTVGDRRYMSPEQVRGAGATQQSDVFALGVLAYELLTGRAPFDSDSAHDSMAAQLLREPRPLDQLRADVDAPLAQLVHKCLAKLPAHRPRAAEVHDALLSGAADLHT